MRDVVDDERPARSGFGRNLLWTIVLGLVGLATFVWLMVFVASGTVTRQVREKWEADGVTRESLAERFPAGGVNASALEAERLARPFGIVLAPRTSDRWESNSQPYRAGFGTIKRAVGDYVETHLERDHREVSAPPPEVARFLVDHAAAIDALRTHLVTADEPRWEQDVSVAFEAPTPNLLAHLDLHRLLHAVTRSRWPPCTRATARARCGRSMGRGVSARLCTLGPTSSVT